MVKISLIGTGRVGSQIANTLIRNEKIDELVLFDVNKSLVDGIYLDLSHAHTEFADKLKIGEYKDMENSKIIIITAGIPRLKDNQSRMELLNINKEIMKDIISKIPFSDETILIILSNPMDIMTFLAYKFSNRSPEKIIGFGNSLDVERLRHIISQKANVSLDKVKSIAIGEHGEKLVPIFSNSTIDGKPIQEYNLDLNEIHEELGKVAKRVIDSTGGTTFGPATNVEKIVNSILDGSNQTFFVSAFVERDDHYEVDNVCLGLPCKIGSNGISEIEKINLNDNEKQKLKESAEKLKTIQTNALQEMSEK